ncbi:DUF4199 domain-containing protein [Marivirga sp. S37H4]|uniref:DUF4199 domain-containing protein n=1 Tax=Marivirga aurantiaca TaxID=2802615 RepID=A0A934X1I5_9BACT|nr:DUF4199 domain-containing protein [Marivirga aurantiaca]MBK6266766.1 DUF4199 domain-containing protein [Marivirga aurantiaca]
MENEEIEQNNTQHAVKWGLILGLISVIITLLVYVIDITIMAKPYFGIIYLVVYIGFVIYAGRKYREESGGYLTYGKAFLHAFVILLLAGFIDRVFLYILFNLIDPQAAETIIKVTMDTTMQAMESFGGGGNPEVMDEMAEGMAEAYTLGGLAKNFMFMIIAYAIGAAIIGAINKKNEPQEF